MAVRVKTIQLSWLTRWLLSACVLIGSLVILSIPLPKHGVHWLQLSSNPWFSLPIPTPLTLIGPIVAALAATFLFTKRAPQEELHRTIAEPPADFLWPVWLGLCVLSVIFLNWLTNELPPIPTLRDLAYFSILTAFAAASWCLGAMPYTFWISWARRNSWAISASACVGVLIYVLAYHYTPLALFNLPTLINPLQRATLYSCAFVLRLCSNKVIFNPELNLIGIEHFSAYLDPRCAGWEGISLFIAFYSLYILLNKRDLRIPHVLVLLPIGCLAIWGLNVIRIVALVLLGAWSDSIGIDGFHSVAGWIFFNLIALGLVSTTERMRLFSKRANPTSLAVRSTLWSNPASPYLLPLLTIIAVGMLATAVSPIVSYPASIAAGALVLWRHRKQRIFGCGISSWAILLGVLVFIVWIGFAPGEHAAHAADVRLMSLRPDVLPPLGAAAWLSIRAVGSVVVAPIAEELAFRGYLLRKLMNREFDKLSYKFDWLSFLGSSVVFGLFHERYCVGIFAGMAFALALYPRHRLFDAITSHSVANGLLSAYVLATQRWALWS